MIQSDSILKIYKALALAQGEFKAIPFDKVNPHFKSKYASLSSTLEMIRSIMAKNGLGLLQCAEYDNGEYFLETRIIHESGEFIASKVKLLVEQQNMQKLGSALTYAKRYQAQSMLSICGDDDDDGNLASKKSDPQSKVESKKNVDPTDFVLNLGSIKNKKLGELDESKLREVDSWLSKTIKEDPKGPKTKFYQYAISQVRKVLKVYDDKAQTNKAPPGIETQQNEIMNRYSEKSEWPPLDEVENPFEEFSK